MNRREFLKSLAVPLAAPTVVAAALRIEPPEPEYEYAIGNYVSEVTYSFSWGVDASGEPCLAVTGPGFCEQEEPMLLELLGV